MKRIIDRLHLEKPYPGIRRMTDQLKGPGVEGKSKTGSAVDARNENRGDISEAKPEQSK